MGREDLKSRDGLIIEMRDAGSSFSSIASIIGIGPQRVRQIYKTFKYQETLKNEWYYGLSVRFCNVLHNLNISSKEEAKKRIVSRDCFIGNRLKWRNFGWKSFEELCLWVGLPKPIKPEPSIRVKASVICPHCGKSLNG